MDTYCCPHRNDLINEEFAGAEKPRDRIEGRNIFLHSQGEFPKKLLIVLENGKDLEYMIRKTRKGKYLLN